MAGGLEEPCCLATVDDGDIKGPIWLRWVNRVAPSLHLNKGIGNGTMVRCVDLTHGAYLGVTPAGSHGQKGEASALAAAS